MDEENFSLTQEQIERMESYKKYENAETTEEKIAALKEMKADLMVEKEAREYDNPESIDDSEDPDEPPVKELVLTRHM